MRSKQTNYTYDAFISYSHSDCGNIAPFIQKGIENIGKPWYAIGRRNLTVFRDETSLTVNPGLWEEIVEALKQTHFFILLASPLAAKSHWIQKEIDWWLSNRDINSVFIVLVKGEIEWNKIELNSDFNWKKTTSIPEILKCKFSSEPLWIDLRPYYQTEGEVNHKNDGFKSQIIKIIAGIVGKDPREIDSAELRRQGKTKVFLYCVFLTIIGLVVVSFFLYNERKKIETEKNKVDKLSKANYLIAQANKISSSNINEALWIYYYAYEENPDSNNFKILEDFYTENSNPKKFFKTLIWDTIDSNLSLSYNKFYLADRIHIKLNPDSISYLENIETRDKKELNIELKCFEDLIYNKYLSKIFLIYGSYDSSSDYYCNKKIIASYNVNQNTTSPILEAVNLKTGSFKFLDSLVENKELAFLFQKDNFSITVTPKNNIFIYPGFTFDKHSVDIHYRTAFCLDLSTKKMKVINLPEDQLEDQIADIYFSPNETFLYYISFSSGNSTNRSDVICRADNGELVKTIYSEGGIDIDSNFTGNEYVPTVIKWVNDTAVFIGTTSGRVILQPLSKTSYFGKMEAIAPVNAGSITSLSFSENFLVAGTDNGLIIIWDYHYSDNYSMAEYRSGFDIYSKINASPNNSIINIDISKNSNRLLCQDNLGKVLQWSFEKSIKLSKDPKVLKKQILQMNIDHLGKSSMQKMGIYSYTTKP